MLFRVAKFDSDTNDFGPTVNVYVTKLGNLGDLRDSVAAKLGVPRENQNLYKESSYLRFFLRQNNIFDKLDTLHGTIPLLLWLTMTTIPRSEPFTLWNLKSCT